MTQLRAQIFSVSIKNIVITSCDDFEAHSGEIVQIVGENGSGKTAFLQCCAGIIPHITGGTVRGELQIAGKDLRCCLPANLQGHVVYVPSAIDMFFMCNSVFDEIVFTLAGSYPDLDLAHIYEKTNSIIFEHNLDEFKDKEISTLSYGQRAKIAALCAIISRAPIILLDEVMSSLDDSARSDIHNLVNTFVQNGGLCVVADHDYVWNNARTHTFTRSLSEDVAPHMIDIREHRGKLISLTGANGSGKTTLLRFILGFVDESDIYPHAHSIATSINIAHPLAYMPQECRQMFRHLVLRDEFPSPLNDHLIDSLGLNELLDHNPSTLSYGQQKRAALATTFSTYARSDLLDEPTIGLDSRTTELVISFLKNYSSSNDVTIICATHDESLISVSDQSFMLNNQAQLHKVEAS